VKDDLWQRLTGSRVGRRKLIGRGAAAGAGLAGLALVGCGDDDDDDDATATETAESTGTTVITTTATSEETTTATGTATAAPTSGAVAPTGEVNMALVTLGDQSSDPHVQNAGNNLPIINSCFEQFSRIDLDGSLIPALAESFEESEDHLTFTATIRSNATFWDGTPVTAEDAAWSYERWTTMETPDTYAAQAVTLIEKVEAPDSQTVLVTMKAPSTLRMRWAGAFAPQGWNIASRAYYETVGDDEFRAHPMATGPFKLIENETQAFVDLEAYPDHYEIVPQVAKIHMELVPEQTTRVARIQTGEADFIDGILGPTLPELESEDGVQLYESEATAKATIYFHSPDVTPYSDQRFRQALGMLIDQQAIIDSLFQGKGSVAPQAHIFPNTIGYDPAIIPPQEHDPEAAAALLEEAGLTGASIKVWSYDSSSAPKIPDSVIAAQNMWADGGIQAEIEQVEAGAYFERYRAKDLGHVPVLGSGSNTSLEALLRTFYLNSAAYGTLTPQDLSDDIVALGSEFDEEAHTQKALDIFARIVEESWSITFPYGNSVWAVRTDAVSAWTPLPGNAYPGTFYTMVPAAT
jgi:peptide/nickel transport system substrate-binding protein